MTGLAVPPVGTEVGRALDYPAVRLFTDRAASSRPELDVDATTLDGIRRVCAELDGLPLAIELAAARVRSMPVAEVAARLHDRFALLNRGSRVADSRHRTLRAVVQWSWELLDPGEHELARRMAVFNGGATLEAVERVCDVPDTVEQISDLADKSLVDVRGERYGMLETVRAFCAERLDEAGETERMRRAHTEYFLALARSADPHLRGAGQLDWLDRLDAERGNLDTALRWATGADTALALRIVGALSMYWWLRGHRAEGALRCRELADAVGPGAHDGLREEYLLCVLTALSGTADRTPLSPHIQAVNTLAREWSGAQEMYGTFNNQEFLDLIQWMREYNTTHDDKIQFMGNDLAYPSDIVFDKVMGYVAKHSPDQSDKFEELYRELRPEPGMGTAAYFEKHRMKLDTDTRKRLAEQANEALELIEKQDPGTDEKAHTWAVQNARAISQTATDYSFDDQDKAARYRDKTMAKNTEWWNKHSGQKMVLSTMASHASYEGYDPLAPNPVGNHLRERMGDSYVSTGLTFNEGSFNSKDANRGPDAGYTTFTVQPAKKGYNEDTLDKVSDDDYMLDMRDAPQEARDWLAKERPHRVIGGTYPTKEDMKLSVGKSYDLLIHMNDIEATKMLPSGE